MARKKGSVVVVGPEILFRRAQQSDLTDIVRLLADDPLAGDLESEQDVATGLLLPYEQAWHEISASEDNEILVATDTAQVIAVLQLTFIPSLTLRGSRRAQIEGVRVASKYRGQGVGTQLVEWAIERAKTKNCRLVQLTMDRRREQAGEFYKRLGFVATHEGFKQEIDPEDSA